MSHPLWPRSSPLSDLGWAGIIALDGTKLKGNAALDPNKTLKAITKELTEAAQIKDLAENAKFGRKRGDELSKHLQGAENRRRRLEEAKRQIEAEPAGKAASQQEKIEKREKEEQLLAMVQQAQAHVARTAAEGVAGEIKAVLADAGYASEANLKG